MTLPIARGLGADRKKIALILRSTLPHQALGSWEIRPLVADTVQPVGQCGQIYRIRKGSLRAATRPGLGNTVPLNFIVAYTCVGIPASNAPRSKGMGLRVAITKTLIMIHNSDLFLNSIEGKGLRAGSA